VIQDRKEDAERGERADGGSPFRDFSDLPEDLVNLPGLCADQRCGEFMAGR
jgi:hypothetical protein